MDVLLFALFSHSGPDIQSSSSSSNIAFARLSNCEELFGEGISGGLSVTMYHEAYHSFQQDLGTGCTRGPNDLWVLESTATYFGRYSVAMSNGDSHKIFVNNLLEYALMHANDLGTKLEDPGVAEKGVGTLRLMIEKGWLEESRVLDGSLFHDCARVKEFSDSDPKIQYLKDHWHEIENNNGNFEFNLSN